MGARMSEFSVLQKACEIGDEILESLAEEILRNRQLFVRKKSGLFVSKMDGGWRIVQTDFVSIDRRGVDVDHTSRSTEEICRFLLDF